MKKIIILAIYIAIAFFSPLKTESKERIADSSAVLLQSSGENTSINRYIQKKAISSILTKRNSVLANHAEAFVDSANKHELDPYLLVSISGLESGFGRAMIHGSYNGYGWGGGEIRFQSWEDGIETISQALRENYYNKGASTIYDVGRRYATSKTWAVRVQAFMNVFKNEEAYQRAMFSVL